MFSTTQPSLAVVALGYGGHGIFVNNTVIGTNPTQTSACTSYDELTNGAPGVIVENNAIEGCGILVGGTGNFPFATFDYNAYANWSGYHCFFTNFNGTAIDVLSYSSWQAMSGLDTHSAADTLRLGTGSTPEAPSHLLRTGGHHAPETGSPLVSSGANLAGLCTGSLTALCQKPDGTPRLTVGALEIGSCPKLA